MDPERGGRSFGALANHGPTDPPAHTTSENFSSGEMKFTTEPRSWRPILGRPTFFWRLNPPPPPGGGAGVPLSNGLWRVHHQRDTHNLGSHAHALPYDEMAHQSVCLHLPFRDRQTAPRQSGPHTVWPLDNPKAKGERKSGDWAATFLEDRKFLPVSANGG